MAERVVRVGRLEEFLAEVPPSGLPVRLSLTDRPVPGMVPGKRLELHLQGINDLGEMVWLMEAHEVNWFQEGPPGPTDRSIYEGTLDMLDLVRAHLRGLGYEIRGGTYGLAEDIKPVRARFECVRWCNEGERWWVEAVGDEGRRTEDEEGRGDE